MSDLNRKDKIIDILNLYITNMPVTQINTEQPSKAQTKGKEMQSAKQPATDYKRVNSELTFIRKQRKKIFKLRTKHERYGETISDTTKEYYQLTKIEETIHECLIKYINRVIRESGSLGEGLKKFDEFFGLLDIHTASDQIILRQRDGLIQGLPDKEKYKQLIIVMADRIISDYEKYQRFIFECDETLDIELIHTLLLSYFNDRLKELQEFYLEQ